MTCCGVATAMSQGSSRMPPPSSDQQVNTGTTPGLPGPSRPATGVGLGTPSADRPGVGRSRCSSRRRDDLPWGPGEPGRRAKGGSGIEKRMEAVMPKEAPLNGDAPTDEDNTGDEPVGPRRRVSEMQAKLHRWAAADPGRRFDDLFNLVHDPTTLIVA